MQNKANLPDTQMNVSSILTKDYENKNQLDTWWKQTQFAECSNERKFYFNKAL